MFAGFAFAFLVKTPVWPFHTWMPETYADLPSPVVAVVGSVQSKAGLYGFLAITPILFPDATRAAAPLMVVLGLIGMLYGAYVALTADDVKRVVAYSSLSHLGLILLAVFSLNPVAQRGALVYMVAHGLFTAGIFIVLGFIEEREETRSIARFGGLGARNPRLAGGLLLCVLAALGLPGLAGFAGELLILTGLYQHGLGVAGGDRADSDRPGGGVRDCGSSRRSCGGRRSPICRNGPTCAGSRASRSHRSSSPSCCSASTRVRS